MLSTALSLAVLTTCGCLVLYGKLPKRIRKLIEKHSLIADLLALVGIYMLLGSTLTALFAASMCGIMISCLLHIANNPDDYLFLYDTRDFLKTQLSQAKTSLGELNEEYKAKKTMKDSELPA